MSNKPLQPTASDTPTWIERNCQARRLSATVMYILGQL
jgi:hypothetical protein